MQSVRKVWSAGALLLCLLAASCAVGTDGIGSGNALQSGIKSLEVNGINPNADLTVSVKAKEVLQADYLGTGLYFSPYEFKITDSDWQTVLKRVDFMRPKYVRCLIFAHYYVSGFDGSGNPIYNFNSAMMQETYKMLDYCEKNGITVVFGEWAPPDKFSNMAWGIKVTDAKWTKMIGECLNYLKNVKNYTCIKYYNFVNEPNGHWMMLANYGEDQYSVFFARWKQGLNNLYNELSSRGFLSWIKIIGPDNSNDDIWIDWTKNELDSKIGLYDMHRYDTKVNVESGNLETELRAKRAVVPAGKPFCLNETGLLEGKIDPDSQSKIRDHIYGTWTLDMVIQSIRAGMSGQINWDLDDAQHVGGGYGQNNLKLWGFWNMYGGINGYPTSDRNPRPWYYTWALMSRYFPQGCQTLNSMYSKTVAGVRATAMKKANGDKYDFTFAIVNDSDSTRTFNLVVPNAAGTCSMLQYDYQENYYIQSTDQLPSPTGTVTADLNAGITMTLKPRAAVILTTMDGGTPVDLSGDVSGGNLAFQKPAVATSSDDTTRTPDKAVDGDLGSRWSSSYTDNQSITFDLGSILAFNRVSLVWEAAYPSQYQILSSTDNNSFIPITNIQTGKGGTEQVGLTNCSGRYVRILGVKRATTYGISIYELGVYHDVTSSSSQSSLSSALTSSSSSPVQGLKVITYQNGAAVANQVYERFTLVNTGQIPLPLSQVTLRYYLKYYNTGQSPSSWNWGCDYSTAGSVNVTGSFGAVIPAQSQIGADCYHQIGFTPGAGSIAPGGSVEIQGRIWADWGSFDSSLNYSYNPSVSAVEWNRVTAYQDGTKVWGVEPVVTSSSSVSSSSISSSSLSSSYSSSSVVTTSSSSSSSSSSVFTGVPIDRTIVLLSKANGYYVSAFTGAANNPLQSRATSVGTAEKFLVKDAGFGLITLVSLVNNLYVSAWTPETNSPLQARSANYNTWEEFTWIINSDNTISLKAAANNNYVSAWKNDANTPLGARATSINDWEKFQWIDVSVSTSSSSSSSSSTSSTSSASSSSSTSGPGFVKIQNARFVRDGKPYLFMGANFWAGINLGSKGAGGDRVRLVRELDRMQAMGIKNLRIMGGTEGPNNQPWRMVPALQTSPGVYDQQVLDGLDFFISEMKKRNMTAVVCLNNFWHWSGGMAQYVSWDEGSAIPYPGDWTAFMKYSSKFYNKTRTKQWFREFISFILNHVNPYTGLAMKDDPIVMSYNLANEPVGVDYPSQYNQWVVDTATYIKSIDKNHLVCIGGGDENQNYAGIDYVTTHVWPQNAGWYDPKNPSSYSGALQKSLAAVQDGINKANSWNKPMVLEEFGLARENGSYDPNSSTTTRDSFYNSMFDAVFKNALQNGKACGMDFWAWSGEGRPRTTSGNNWQVGDQWLGDPPHEPQGWYGVYDKDTTTINVIKNFAGKMATLQ